MSKKLKSKIIVLEVLPNRRGTKYVDVRATTDVSRELLEGAIGSLIDNNGTVDISKVHHTSKYIFKCKAKSFIRCTVHVIKDLFYRTAHVIKAIREACGKDFDRNKYVGDMR